MEDTRIQTALDGSSESFQAKEYFEQYWRYSSIVRNWLVAFGVGCCVLLIGEDKGIFKDIDVEKKTDIVFWLIVGVIAQILLALLNKFIHWYVYRGMENKGFRECRRYKVASTLSNWFLIDVIADVFTVIVFVVAICKMFRC